MSRLAIAPPANTKMPEEAVCSLRSPPVPSVWIVKPLKPPVG
jgi:hypothetical protein